MKAAVMHAFGDADVLKYEDVTTPEPRPGHLLIRVLAAGINRFDHYIREGSVAPELPFPHILGADAVGEIVALGDGVTDFAIGDRIIPAPGYPLTEEEWDLRPINLAPSFTLPGLGRWGTYAQFMEVPARFATRDRTGLAPEEVATLPMVLSTSVHAVREIGGVEPGDRVLVHAGAGGAGSMQVQVAKALGAQVATTVRAEADAEFAHSLGADLVIDTRDDDFVGRVRDWTDGQGADVVIDSLGGDILAGSIEAARATGTIVAYGFSAGTQVSFDIRNLFFAEKRIRGSMASDVDDLAWGLELVRQGQIRPALDRTLPLREAAEAHRLIASNQITGNLVLLPWAA